MSVEYYRVECLDINNEIIHKRTQLFATKEAAEKFFMTMQALRDELYYLGIETPYRYQWPTQQVLN